MIRKKISLVILLGFTLFHPFRAEVTGKLTLASTPTIEQWGQFEQSFHNPKEYKDPYRDVSLEVTYTGPGNASVRFWGFYDGGHTWKIRFMPDKPGSWKYSAQFSDGTAAGKGGFMVTEGDIPGMISKDEGNPIWFGYKGGKHMLIRGFHIGDRFFASNWPDSERKKFLDWAQAQGYNLFSLASHLLNRDAEGRGRGWKTPDLWDDTSLQPNPSEYRKMEIMLDDLAERKIMVFPFAGWFGQSSDFPVDKADQEMYIRYNLARIGSYWNILINVAGPEPVLKPGKFRNAMSEEDVSRLGAMIAAFDPFGHLVSIHNKSGHDPFRHEEWVGYSTLQGGKNFKYEEVNRYIMQNHTGRKPVYAQECFWPGNKYHMQYPSDTQIRKKGWTLLLSGASINYADMDGNSSSGFSGSLDLNDRIQSRHDIMKKAWDFMETIPFYRMKPDNNKVSRGFCLAEEGEQYLVYLANGGNVDIQVKEGATYNLSWIDGRNPEKKTDGGITQDGLNLNPPAGGEDWLLYMTKVHSNRNATGR